ncbi:Putative insecticidal toxin complex [uncultured Gammaproteobacteria bacterium]|nr:Putative insecticidal toxin complex [uncultured Gammaproteobacteria bacterium]
MNLLEPYHQTYTYDTGNNLTHLSHQANSSTWQQTLIIHPNNNRGTETQPSATDFDANGNLLTLDNIGTLHWHYNNTLNQLTKADKSNSTQYYVYDYQGNRVRTVAESNNQAQSQRDYLPSLELSINQAKQQTSTLHIGTHIFSETSKDNIQNPVQTRYQLTSHLQSNTLELDDKAQTLSYEHYYPYGGTAIIAGKDKTQVQQKRYRYTGKERDDSSGLYYYGARYLAPWLARWISPDSAGAVDGLNLYVYVGNNPLKYTDPTGHCINTISNDEFFKRINKDKTSELNIWVGDAHHLPDANKLLLTLAENIDLERIGNLVIEEVNVSISGDKRPTSVQGPAMFRTIVNYAMREYNINEMQAMTLSSYTLKMRALIGEGPLIDKKFKGIFIGGENWKNPRLEVSRIKGGMLAIVGACHLLTSAPLKNKNIHPDAFPVQDHLKPDTSIALIPRNVIIFLNNIPFVRQGNSETEFGLWINGKDNKPENAFLVIGRGEAMRERFGDVMQPTPMDLRKLLPIKEPSP